MVGNPEHLFVQSVESNVKRGVRCALSRLTLLCGPNTAGKTSVVQSVELALSGAASDIEGRELVKRNDMLARLGPKSAPLTARATLSDGRESVWTLRPNSRGGFHDPDAPTLKDVRVVYPVQEIQAILAGGPDTVRRWLMSRVGVHIQRSDVLERLPEGVPDLYERLVRQVKLQGDGQSEVDLLLAVITEAAKQARAQAAENRAVEQTIAEISESYADEPTASDLEQAAAIVQQAVEALAQGQALLHRVQQRPNLEAYKQAARLAIEAFQQADRAAVAAAQNVMPLQPQERRLIDLRTRLADTCTLIGEARTPQCLICEAQLPAGLDLKKKAENLRAANQAGMAAIAARALADREAENAASARRKAEEAIQQVQKVEQELQQLGPPPSVDVSALAQAVTDARCELQRLQMLKQQWNSTRASRDKARKGKELVSKLKDLEASCNSVVEELLQRAQKRFEAEVQKHLPGGDRFALVLVEGKKEVCRLGFRRGDALHTALSGAEWARLTLALGCATFKPDPKTLAIFIPEERDFDGRTLAAVMEALQNAPGQVFLQSTTEPQPENPASISAWTIIRPGSAT